MGLLSYDTVAVLRVKDKRLGGLYLACVVGIVAYVVGWNLLWQKRYLLCETPTGFARLSARRPAEWSRREEITYCKSEDACLFWDESLSVWPQAADNSVSVASRVDVTHQRLEANCSPTSPECKWTVVSSDTSWVAEPERYTILFDHGFLTDGLGISGNVRNLHSGRLVDKDGKEMRLSPLEVVGRKGHFDVLQVGTLLRAAGIDSLERPCESASRRYDGLVLVVQIDYTNTRTLDLRHVHYTYSARLTRAPGPAYRALRETKYKAVQSVYTKNVDEMVLYSRHGVHAVVVQAGRLGKFDFQTLVLTLVSGIGLLAVVTVLVDFVATRCVSGREVYHSLKYRVTSDISDMSREELARLAERLQQFNELSTSPEVPEPFTGSPVPLTPREEVYVAPVDRDPKAE